ncbi:unnamed protein product [Paramecium pentaurelia]|uniref:Uncharacterized protein n=1 Tax=Paramecium pentaurelia TaxID=43138 RepID=A0A8S1UJP0_9CILI|nr:unnamed protein product [Paramecium pentaurelia]
MQNFINLQQKSFINFLRSSCPFRIILNQLRFRLSNVQIIHAKDQF